MSTTWIRVAYGGVIAILFAFTVVFGIHMVTPGPKPPSDPGITFRQLQQASDDGGSGGQNRLTNQIDNLYGEATRFRNDYPSYQRNVFIAATAFGVLAVLLGLALPAVVNYLRWGLVLGGLLLFGYAFYFATRRVPTVVPEASSFLGLIGAGHAPQLSFASRFIEFAVSFIGLILALFLGLWRLTEWSPAPRRTAAAPAPTPVPIAPAVPAAAPTRPQTISQWAPPPPAPPAGPTAPAPAPGSEHGEGPMAPVEAAGVEWRRPE
jgi:hypothetical protein